MVEHSKPSENEANSGEIRGQLVKRLAVAGVLVALLLGVLALFDRLSTNEEIELPVFTQPVPVAPRKEVTQPVTAASHLPEPPTPVVQEAPPAPVVEEPVLAKAAPNDSPKPEIGTAARSTVRHPKIIAPTVESPPRPHTAPGKTVSSTPQPVPESSAEPVAVPSATPVPEAKPAVSPAARISEVRRSPVAAEPGSMQRLFSGFLLQAGVFSSAQRAEELHVKLTLSGVPSTLETRVQVGPFKTRQEAEAAQEKLKQLGVESLLVPPKGSRN